MSAIRAKAAIVDDVERYGDAMRALSAVSDFDTVYTRASAQVDAMAALFIAAFHRLDHNCIVVGHDAFGQTDNRRRTA